MISDSAPKYEDADPEESEKRGGPGNLHNFGITNTYDRNEKASKNRKGRECSRDKIEKFC